MVNRFEFDAQIRPDSGTRAARALRRDNRVPVVLYGAGGDPVRLSVDHNEVLKKLENEAVYSHILTLNIDGKQESAILKGLQRHPAKSIILHMDFMRVSKSDKIRVHVPLHFVNEDICVGVKAGGVVTHVLVDVEVGCLPSDLPEFIEVDLSNIGIGESVHLSGLSVPSDVEIVALSHDTGRDSLVASVQTGKSAEADDDVDVDEEASGEESTGESDE